MTAEQIVRRLAAREPGSVEPCGKCRAIALHALGWEDEPHATDCLWLMAVEWVMDHEWQAAPEWVADAWRATRYRPPGKGAA